MNFDELYDSIGHIGTYQQCVVVLIFVSTIFTLEAITLIFVGAEMSHWCRVPELANYSHERQRLVAIPWSNQDDPSTYHRCEMYRLSYDRYSHEEILNWNRSEMILDTSDTVSCTQWNYDQSVFISTIVSRFNLVCGAAYFNQLVSTIYMFGVLVGVTSSGAVSDKIGRRVALFVYMIIRLVGYSLAFPASHYAMLAVGRFIIGTGTAGVFLTTYVLAAELVGPSVRTAVGVGLQIAFSIGFSLTALLSYAVRHEVKYQVASMAGPAVLLLLLVVFLPESPRWLAVNGRKEEAMKILDDICRVNLTSLPENFNINDLNEEKNGVKRKNFVDLFKSPKLRMRTIVMDFSWFTCSLVYYALSLNTGSLSGDIFINTILSGLVEIPANVVCIFLLDWSYLGRRLSLSGTFLIAGLFSFICVPLTIYNYGTASTAMAMIGKASVTMSFSIVYVYSSELFPTEVRHIGIGAASMFARVASMIAPYMGTPLNNVWAPFSSLVFGCVATFAGLLGLLLPETLGHPMLDTIEQAEQYQWKKTALCKDKVAPVNPPNADNKNVGVHKSYHHEFTSASRDENSNQIDANQCSRC